jgi:hypothetical protein
VDGNLFGLRSSGGTAEMWTEGGLHASIRLEQMEKRGFIIGYPEVIYGYKPFGALLSDQSPLLRLPLKLSEIPELWSFSDYAVISGKDPDLALDVAYDFWLTREPKPSTIRKGDIELMVWTYHRNLRPAGALIKDSGVDIPTWINGTLKKAHWVAYLSDVDSPTRTSILISFALDEDGSGGAENGGISQGLVGVNLKEILHQTVILVNRKAGWESSYVSGLFVNDIELGTEFGTNQDHAAFDWELKSYRFVIGSREVGNEGKF